MAETLGAVTVPTATGLHVSKPFQSVAHISLNSPPTNILTLDMWKALDAALSDIESDNSTTVLIFSSGLLRPVFSAGNDLTELHAPSTSRERYAQFWTSCTRFLASLYESPLYTIAALRGACPAGGCILALCCDERIALEDGTVLGLNEASLGIPVPRYWAQLMLKVGGSQPAEVERLLSFGAMIDARRAHRLGLIDSLVDSNVEKAAETRAASLVTQLSAGDGASNIGRIETKALFRRDFARSWRNFAEEEARSGWEILRRPDVSKQLGRILHKLQGKKAGARANL